MLGCDILNKDTDEVRQLLRTADDFLESSCALSAEDYRQAFCNIQNNAISVKDCLVLANLLRSSNTTQVNEGLNLIMRLSLTSQKNKEMLLQHGIATELKRLICLQKSLSEEILILAMNAVNNLLLSEMGQNAFTDMMPQIVDSCLSTNENLATASLQCLTNLTLTVNLGSHASIVETLPCLLGALDVYQSRRLQICKVLVNLSACSAMVPCILAAKIPWCARNLLVEDEDTARRWLRFMVNITQAALDENVTEKSLPVKYKAASPETTYCYLYGSSNQLLLDSLLIHNYEDDELNQLSNTLYKNIKMKKILTAMS